MNPVNYVTLEQAKEMKELGYPQGNELSNVGTDCIWIGFPKWVDDKPEIEWQLRCRDDFADVAEPQDVYEWFAAPNAQEIELHFRDGFEIGTATGILFGKGLYRFGYVTEAQAQARANAWISNANRRNYDIKV